MKKKTQRRMKSISNLLYTELVYTTERYPELAEKLQISKKGRDIFLRSTKDGEVLRIRIKKV